MTFEKIKKYYIENKLIANCIFLAVLFFVNCFVQGFGFFVFAIVAGLIIWQDRKIGFSILIFSLPFAGIEGYPGLYCLFACFVIYLIKHYIILFFVEKKKINYIFLSVLIAFILYSLLPIGNYNIQLFIKLFSILFLVLTLNLCVRYTDILNLRFNLTILAIGLIISSAYFLTYYISPFVHNKPIWAIGDNFIRFTAFFTMNPNVLAMICEISLCLLTFYMLQDKFEWTDVIAYIIFAVIGLTTISKTFLILFSIMFLIMLVYVVKRYRLKALWVVCLVLILIAIALIFKGDFLMTYIGRFIKGWDSDLSSYEGVLDTATTGRYKLWTTVLEYMFINYERILIGWGLGAPMVASMSAHNFYISMLYEMGIIGSALFISLFILIVRGYKKQCPQNTSKAILVPIVIFALLFCAEDLFLYIY